MEPLDEKYQNCVLKSLTTIELRVTAYYRREGGFFFTSCFNIKRIGGLCSRLE